MEIYFLGICIIIAFNLIARQWNIQNNIREQEYRQKYKDWSTDF